MLTPQYKEFHSLQPHAYLRYRPVLKEFLHIEAFWILVMNDDVKVSYRPVCKVVYCILQGCGKIL